MNGGENTQVPNDPNEAEKWMRQRITSLLDQFTALKEDVSGQSDASLNLAAAAENLAQASKAELSQDMEKLQTVILDISKLLVSQRYALQARTVLILATLNFTVGITVDITSSSPERRIQAARRFGEYYKRLLDLMRSGDLVDSGEALSALVDDTIRFGEEYIAAVTEA